MYVSSRFLRRSLLQLLLLCVAVPLVSCGDSNAPEDLGEGATIVATTPAMAYLSRRLAAPEIEVLAPLPDGTTAEHWQPDRAALELFQRAGLIAANGAGTESFLDGASLPESRVARTADGFRERWLETAQVTHSHGAGEHTHATKFDGHTWLSPTLLALQAEALAQRIAESFPQHAPIVRDRLAALRTDLELRAARCDALGSRSVAGQLFDASESLAYLTSEHGFQFETLALNPNGPLADDARSRLTAAADASNAPVVLFTTPPGAALRAALVSCGASVVLFGPAADPAGDVLVGLDASLDALESALP